MKRTFLFATIASILSTGAFATSSTVTSKDYVDAQDALKQDKIPVTGTNSATLGDTVVTYTDTEGTIGERGIFDGTSTYTDADADTLVTTGVVADMAAKIENITIPNTELECYEYDNNECVLWEITSSGTTTLVSSGTFAPLIPCKAYGESVSSRFECCSRRLISGGANVCGCSTNDDCTDGGTCNKPNSITGMCTKVIPLP